jgi:hypothetical protein
MLKTDAVSPTKTPFWKDSLICSAREQYLNFKIVYVDMMDILDSMSCFAVGEMYFVGSSIFREKNFDGASKIVVVELKGSDLQKIGIIQLAIEYDRSRNYLGEMEFFEIETIDT